jgi:hypothetical protein
MYGTNSNLLSHSITAVPSGPGLNYIGYNPLHYSPGKTEIRFP